MPDADRNDSTDAPILRAQAAALISQGRGQIAALQQALASAPAGTPLHTRLAATAAQASAAIAAVSQSLDAPGSTVRQADLLALEGVVFSGEAATLVSEATAQTASAAAATQAVAAASAATRQETQTLARDMFGRRLFDPYLHFASAGDEAAYRKHEDDTRRYVEQQLGRHTPEGDLNAGGGMVGQMLDAHAHGAGDSPDFLPRWNALTEKVERQHAAMRAAGQSTEEYDRNLSTSVRHFLQAKGLSEAEIEQRLSASADPLKAVGPFLRNDADSRKLETLASTSAMQAEAHPPIVALPRVVAADPSASPAPLSIDLDAMSAKLKAAGVQMTEGADIAGHGLTVPKPAAQPGLQIGG